jgi:DNA gyrase subunit B
MPQAIERGYVYIAKPPLYRVAKGRQERYLQNEREMDDYLMDALSTDGLISAGDGVQIAGADFKRILGLCLEARNILQPLAGAIPVRFVEALALSGCLSDMQGYGLAGNILDSAEHESERGWKVSSADEGILIERTLRSVVEQHMFPIEKLSSGEVRAFNRMAGRDELIALFRNPLTLSVKQKTQKIWTAFGLLDTAFEYARNGLTINRYKGLGEMTADQLWETTMDPNHRTLFQVRITDATKADEIVSMLMGEIVEPRRDFIVDNALSANVDI